MKSCGWLALLSAMTLGSVQAATQEVAIHLVSADQAPRLIGTVTLSETEYGVLFTPKLTSLPAGVHGFHVHANGSCDTAIKDGKKVAALAAGGHFDPQKSDVHSGPYGKGHLGDLPALYVNADGSANDPVLAPRIASISQITGHALMVHAGGDNHSDAPIPLGGGGGRMACGVI